MGAVPVAGAEKGDAGCMRAAAALCTRDDPAGRLCGRGLAHSIAHGARVVLQIAQQGGALRWPQRIL